MKILLAYDGGDPARRALELTAELAHKFGANVAVVSVVPVHLGRVPIDPWDDAPVHATQLAEAKQLLLGHGIEPVLIEQAGNPALTIERIAEDGGYDMVVVGSRHLGTLSRVLQGSVSEHVATHAAATVVVAR
jgi:nucleotide-binding universal stress UspA family protein